VEPAQAVIPYAALVLAATRAEEQRAALVPGESPYEALEQGETPCAKAMPGAFQALVWIPSLKS
jgi:hypothetical protein